MFYLITISAATLLIAAFNFWLHGVYLLPALGSELLITALGVVAVFAIDGLMAFVSRLLPEKWFLPEASLFSVPKWEKNFYRKIKLNEWKKYVPEWGCFTGFHKDKMRSPDDPVYIGRFLIESNYGVAGHITGAVFGFLIMLIPPLPTLTAALPIAIVNMILSILPMMILRFNTPALRRLYRRNLDRANREAKSISAK